MSEVLPWDQPCASCRGDAGHESCGPQGWIPDPCTCHPALAKIREMEGDLWAVRSRLRDVEEARSAVAVGEVTADALARLRPFLKHDPLCNVIYSSDEACSCGMYAALDAARGGEAWTSVIVEAVRDPATWERIAVINGMRDVPDPTIAEILRKCPLPAPPSDGGRGL